MIEPSAALGYLPGSAGVDSGGAATYTIPLAVPPGVRGMQPNLSLAYSSRGGHGILGLGWSLIGASQIERCYKTLRTEGVVAGYDLSDEDSLCLNGAKLVQVGTTPEGPEYRTEASPFDKIVHRLSDDSFEMRSADGRISTYKPLSLPRYAVADVNNDGNPNNNSGKIAPWRVTMEPDGNAVLMWPLDRVEDRFGNAMHYRYQTTVDGTPELGQGTSTVLESITYTHHPDDPNGATREVKLVYGSHAEEARHFTYVNGIRLNHFRRLQRVEMHAPSKPGGLKTKQWSYELDYLPSPSGKTGRTQLVGVRQCDAAQTCGWKKEFHWKGQGEPLQIQASYSPVSATDPTPWQPYEPPGIDANETRPIVLDADGDGRQDVLLLHTDGLDPSNYNVDTSKYKWKLLLSSLGYAPRIVSYNFYIDGDKGHMAPGRHRVTDVNNDGRDDLIVGVDEGDDDDLSNNATFVYRCYTWDDLSEGFVDCMAPEIKDMSNAGWGDVRWHSGDRIRWPLWNFADFDGDGRVDLVENDHIRKNLGTASSLAVFEPSAHPLDLVDFDDAPNNVIAWQWKAYNRGAEAYDVNGDGRAELALSNPLIVGVNYATGPDAPLSGADLRVHALGQSPGGATVDSDVAGLTRGAGPWAYEDATGNIALVDDNYFFSVSADVNGDGLKDQVIVRHITKFESTGAHIAMGGDDDDRGGIGTFVQYNTGRGYTPAVRTTMQFRPIEQWLLVGPLTQFDGGASNYYTWNQSALPAAVDVVDVNDDGRDDIVVKSMETWQWNEHKNELELLVEPVIHPPQTHVDYTNVNHGSTFWHTRIYLSTGDDFRLVENPFDPGLPTRKGSQGYVYTRPAQLDDDPAPEYIARGRAHGPSGDVTVQSWMAGEAGEDLVRVDLDAGPPEVIWAVRDQFAPEPREIFTYHDKRFSRTGDGCHYPFACPSGFYSVVDEHHSAQGRDRNGQVIYRRTKYELQDPHVDLRGRGMLGFDAIQTTDLDSGAVTVSIFGEKRTAAGDFFPYAGMATEVRTYTPILTAPDDGQPNLQPGNVRVRVVEKTLTPDHKLLNGGKTYFSYVSQEIVQEYEKTMELALVNGEPRLYEVGSPNMVPLSYVQTSAQYDDFGNVEHSTTTVAGGETRQTTSTYLNDDDKWLIRLPVTTETTSMNWIRRMAYVYDAKGHLEEIHVQPNDPDLDVRSTTHRVRDERGLVIQIGEEAPGVPVRVTNLYYDEDDVFVAQAINAAGHASTVLRHPALGVPVLTQDALGVVSLAKFDGFGRLVSTDGPTDLDVGHVSYKAFENADNDIIGIIATTLMTDGSEQSVSMDEIGRAVRSMVKGFDGDKLYAATHYNLFGQAVTTTRMAKGAPSMFTTDVVYDTLGRVLLHSAPDGVETHFEYGPDEMRTVDALGHERRVLYDEHHRPMLTEEEIVANGQAQVLTTTFQYGAFDLVERTVDPAGNTISLRMDVLGRKIRIEDPDAGGTEFRYNGLGELVRKTTPQGQAIHMAYDDLGRPVSVTDSDGTTSYTWDVAPNGVGQLAYASAPDNVVMEYEYDALGRTATSRMMLDGAETFEIDNAYDTFGRIAEIAYPEDPSGKRFTASFDYNPHGYPKSVSRTNLAPDGMPTTELVWETLERDDNLALTWGKFGNDIMTRLERDPATGMVEKITADQNMVVSGSPRFEVSYAYTALRNVKARTWSGTALDGQTITESFDYDVLDRLTEWHVDGPVKGGAGERTYQYDTMGNLTRVLKDGATVYQATYGWGQLANALASSTPTSVFEYDAGGRQTKAGAREVDYTDFDMPRSVTIDAVTTDFRYGPGGQRVEKRSPDGRTVYAFGLYEKRETAEGIHHVFFVPGDTGIVAQVTRTEDVDDGAVTEDIAYFTRDHLGSSAAAFDQAGATEVQIFDPWGERIYHTGASTALMTVVDHGYTDQRHEEDLGWIDMNARMYDPAQRRFISPDPLVADPLFSTGRNRFAYVLNNPMRYTDPTGLGVKQTIVHPPPVSKPTTKDDVIIFPDAHITVPRDRRPGLDTGEDPSTVVEGQPTAPHPVVKVVKRQESTGVGDGARDITLADIARAWAPNTFSVMGPGPQMAGLPPALAQLHGGVDRQVSEGGAQSAGLIVQIGSVGAELQMMAGQAAIGAGATAALSAGSVAGPAVAAGGSDPAARAKLLTLLVARLRQAAGFSEKGIPIILDENLQGRAVAQALRLRGFNVRSVVEIFGRPGIKDPTIREVAQQLGARVLTRDRGRQLGEGFGRLAIQVDQRAGHDTDALVRILTEALK